MSIKGAVQGLLATTGGAINIAHQSKIASEKEAEIKEAEAKQQSDKEVEALYSTTAQDLMGDVYNTTRKVDRNVFMQQFDMANNLAIQRQQFIDFQMRSVKDRIKNVGGLGTEEGQKILKGADKKLKPIITQTRKDLTQFRKPVGGKK